jgi:hypothetical protein
MRAPGMSLSFRTFATILLAALPVFGSYFPPASPILTVNPATATNPLPVRLTDGTSFLTSLPVAVNNFPLSLKSVQSGDWTVSVSNFPATQPVSGSVSVSNLPSTQAVSGTVAISGSVAVTGSFYQTTQPVSVSSLPLPSGASTSANQTTANSSLSSIDAKIPSGLTMSGDRLKVDIPAGSASLTNTELRASAVPVSLTSTTITNFPTTQAVTGAFYQATQPVSIASMPTTPVTGTFWQSTQPVSIASSVAVTGPLTDTQLRATALPVSGTFYQSTQPVSIASMPTTPVTGTFWQTTQPVSIASSVAVTGPLTDTQIRATALPVSLTSTTITNFPASQAVTGTFFQATQPVSIAASVSVTGPLTDTQLRATPLPISGTVTANTGLTQPLTDTQLRATALPVSIASALTTNATLAAETTKVIGTVNIAASQSITANAGTNLNTSLLALDSTVAKDASLTTLNTSVNTLLKPASTLSAVTTVGSVTSITNALPTGTNSIGTVQAPTITKGTQGTTGFTTQDIKDAGRVSKAYSASFTAAITEALVTLTPISDGTAGVAATTFAVTAGKRLRIMNVCVTTRNAGAAGQGVVVQLRITSTGAVTATSPLVATVAAGTSLAIANVSDGNCVSFSDGLELSGTQQFGVTQIGSATANNTVVVHGYEY